MSKQDKSRKQKTIVRTGIRIGFADASEDREFLDNCYVENNVVSTATSMDDPGCIVLGRTGAGKSAALYKLETTQDNCITINPSDLALSYVSNSTIIGFFHKLGVDLDLFFQLLWRHVLTIELLNYRYKVKNRSDFDQTLDNLKSMIGLDHARKVALEYLSEWGTKFWEDTEVRVKEIVEKFEGELKAGVGIDKFGIEAGVDVTDKLSQEQKAEVIYHGQKVVSKVQIKKLSNLMDLMADKIFDDRQQKYFILIDRLDEDWVDDDLRYRMIRALIETIKAFRKVRNVKIVVALRYDLLERVFKHTESPGFQREKFDDYIIPIKWNKDQLIQLVSDRINYIYKSKYTTENVSFYDLFPKRYRNKSSTQDHLVHRTQFRPRDIIAFTNLIFAKTKGGDKFTATDIDEAEKEYSRKRLQALTDEWRDEFPNLDVYLNLLRGMPKRFKLSEISDESVEECFIKMSEQSRPQDAFSEMSGNLLSPGASDKTTLRIKKELISTLYKVGAIGVKIHHGKSVMYAYQHPYDLEATELEPDTFVSVSPVLWSTLQIVAKNIGGEIVS